jgi:hypothetical protein
LSESLIETDVVGLPQDDSVRLVEALSEAPRGEEFYERVTYHPPHVERSRVAGEAAECGRTVKLKI